MDEKENIQPQSDTSSFDEDLLEKIDSVDVIKYLNVTPRLTTKKWGLYGVGITESETSYNPNVSEEHWIIHKNANKDTNGYALSTGPEQTCYKGDPVFEFIDDIRFGLKTNKEAESEVLEIDKYKVTDESTTPKYRARLFKVCIAIDSRSQTGGEGVKIKYSINYKGDPTIGTVTFDSKGEPTFAEG